MEQYRNELLEETRQREYNEKKYTTQDLIQELTGLLGEEVYVFGQRTKLNSKIPEFCIDTRDILEGLEDYDLMEIINDHNIELSTEFWDKLDRIDINYELVEKLKVEGVLEEVGADNTYNWCSPVYNDIDYNHLKDRNDNHYIALCVHRYGDVRGNYTDTVVYKFGYDTEFLEFLNNVFQYF